ncbi:MAG: 1-acyl-sn-glycerol-3-phosphate acyltransferase [Sphingomonas sp.]|nr:1-acyl-sn-glycerol-3-phosphate acyltransferase [Sphingomonas sp.]
MAATRIAAFLLWLAICLPPHLATKLLTGRSGWPRRFLAGTAWICGARVRVTGAPVQAHTLLVANHTSWLDIFVLADATGCAFVSKQELGNPLVLWLADQNHTLYVKRQDRRGASRQAQAIARKLLGQQPVALFPEGTTGGGDELLPFRPALLGAVTPPPPGVTVRPVAIDYGAVTAGIGWTEESGKDNLLRVLGRRLTIPVTVRLLDPLPPSLDRKALSNQAREAIAAALTSSRRVADL